MSATWGSIGGKHLTCSTVTIHSLLKHRLCHNQLYLCVDLPPSLLFLIAVTTGSRLVSLNSPGRTYHCSLMQQIMYLQNFTHHFAAHVQTFVSSVPCTTYLGHENLYFNLIPYHLVFCFILKKKKYRSIVRDCFLVNDYRFDNVNYIFIQRLRCLCLSYIVQYIISVHLTAVLEISVVEFQCLLPL